MNTLIKTRKTWLMAGAAVAVIVIGGAAFLMTRDGPAPSPAVEAPAEAGHEGEAAGEAEILSVEIDLQRSEHVRRIWPFLRDRRIDAYGDLLKRYID